MNCRAAWPRHARAGSGFTLVELLVVIAVIAILVALLARARARQAQCASNLGQIHKAWTQAVAKLPAPLAIAQWPQKLSPYVEQQRKVYLCPDDLASASGSSYGLHSRAARMADQDNGRILLLDYRQVEAKVVGQTLGQLNDDWPTLVAPRHFQQLNVAFVDGHTEPKAADAIDPRYCEKYVRYWRPARDGKIDLLGCLQPGQSAGTSGAGSASSTGSATSGGTGATGSNSGGSTTVATTTSGTASGGTTATTGTTSGSTGGTGTTAGSASSTTGSTTGSATTTGGTTGSTPVVTACGETVPNGFVSGLRGEWWNATPSGAYTTPPFATRIEPTISFPYGMYLSGWNNQPHIFADGYNDATQHPPNFPPGLANPETFAGRWKGEFRADVTGPHQFWLKWDDGTQVIIDNVTIHDALWHTWQCYYCHPEPRGPVFNLVAGQWYCLEVKNGNHCCPTWVQLLWQPPGAPGPQVIPTANLRTPAP